MTEKLKSRKFWISFLVLVLIAFGKALGLEFSEDAAWQIAIVATGYVGAQGYVDRGLVEPQPAPKG